MDDYSVTNQRYQTQEIPREYESVEEYATKTFGWIFLGLMVTFLVSMVGYMTGAIIHVFMIPHAIFVLAVAGVAMVLFLSVRINKVSVGVARDLFFLYAVLNGIVFPAYFLMYNMLDTVVVFVATSTFFGMMAAAGYVTKADLSKLRSFLMDGLVFLVAFWLLGIFINLAQFEMIAYMVGIFTSLLSTAYDTQKIKAYHVAYGSNPEMTKKASVFSALQLYLDFISLFLYLLRVLNRRK